MLRAAQPLKTSKLIPEETCDMINESIKLEALSCYLI
jgi:hypothetical protein